MPLSRERIAELLQAVETAKGDGDPLLFLMASYLEEFIAERRDEVLPLLKRAYEACESEGLVTITERLKQFLTDTGALP